MSRSKNKTPITGISIARSEKAWKRNSNQKLRRASAVAVNGVRDYDALVLPVIHEVSNEYYGPKDGKMYFDAKKYAKLLRK